MTEFPVKVFIRMISDRIVTKLWKLIDVMSRERMICHEHHSVILRLWVDKDLQKKIATRMALVLKFKVTIFLIASYSSDEDNKFQRNTVRNSTVLLEKKMLKFH